MKALKRMTAAASLAALMAGCVVAPVPDYGEEMAPPLPAVVDLDEGNYYYYRNHHYRYDGERWHYARDRGGQWRDLPRTHWPGEVRHREGVWGHEGGMGHGGALGRERGGWHERGGAGDREHGDGRGR